MCKALGSISKKKIYIYIYSYFALKEADYNSSFLKYGFMERESKN
jgi:hypothetical protein